MHNGRYMMHSHSLLFSDFKTDWYKRWAKELKQNKDNLEGHSLKANKFWQNAVMAQILFERDLLVDGKSGIGFGVGQERLPALFANKGVKITATDQDFRTDKAKLWQKHELAQDAHSLNKLLIASPEKFNKNISFQAVDMTKIPKKLSGLYDFVWSNCALGHLGSIDAGLGFIVNSARCLKPGGYGVHTTEVNVLSNNETVDSGDTVVFRPKDIYRLSKLLAKEGCELEPLRLTFGSTRDDRKITMHPEYGNSYSKIHFRGHLLTQVVLIIRKPVGNIRLSSGRQRYFYLRNILAQKNFKNKTPFLKNISDLEKSQLDDGSIKPIKTEMGVLLKNKPKYVYIEFENTSNKPIFGIQQKTNNSWPIVLATAGPSDRKSIFQADDWFNNQPNRPSAHIFTKDKKGSWTGAGRIKPGSHFAYRIKFDPANVENGNYIEKFAIVQEGNRHLLDTEVAIKVRVLA